jgi:Zn-dependent alcohol dehydrogenase
MRAAVCRAFGEPLVIEDVQIAAPARGELRVRLAACAICQSDLHYLDGAWGGSLPAVFGHEAAGVVVEVGTGAGGSFTEGDHVVVTLIRSCGVCASCVHGEPALCDATFALDEAGPLTAADGHPIAQGLRTGSFAEEVVVDASQAVGIPADLPLDRAALLACGVITGFGAVVNTAGVEPGATVVVIGTGGVGLNAVQGAVHAGAATVVAIDLSDAKLATARAFGATHTVSSASEDAVAAVLALTGGRGADYVIVTVGAGSAVEQGALVLRRAGTMVIVGMPASGVLATIDPGTIANDGQRILGSKMGSARIEVDIPMLAALYQEGRLKLDELISARYPFEQINEAIAASRGGSAIRNVIVF